MSDWKEKIEAQIEYLTTMLLGVQFQQRSRPSMMLAESIESLKLLLDVAVAAEDDRVCAEAHCGKTGGDRDCSAYVSRGLRCSDCPVEVWLESTVDALDKLRDDSIFYEAGDE